MSGELLRDGRYEIVGTLGEGAQGTTFDGVDRSNGQPVAIKRFSVKGAKSWKDVDLAEREANVLASLSHPALPRHVDHFEEAGALYLVMEKIEGETLASIAKRGARFSTADVVRFLGDAATLLDYLHGRSPPVIHRDINPKNVLQRPDGSFAFVDFGAVRDRLKPEGGSTVVGTFGYMATEQFQGRALPASDVYSVGATALRMLTGVEPENLPHRGLAIDVRAALGPSIEPELRRVLEKMLDPDPDRRASSIRPLLASLASARASRPAPSSRNETRPNAGDRAGQSRRHDNPWGGNPVDWEQFARDVTARAWEPYAHYEQSRHARRRAERDARREQKRARRRRRRGPLRGPPLLFALLGLNVAMLVVAVAVGFAVPLALTVLSILFGPALRSAALRVREAAGRAHESMRDARRYLIEGPRASSEPPRPSGVRVDASDVTGAARQRVETDDDVIDTTGTDVDSTTRGHADRQ